MSGAFTGLPRIDLRHADASSSAAWQRRCRRSAGLAGEADEVARRIVADVRERGDAALIELTERFEGRTIDAASIEIGRDRRAAAIARVAPALRDALDFAARRILAFHRLQLLESTGCDIRGSRLQSRIAPLRRVAVYAPGGTASYPSSVLMAAIPAKVAGVPEVVLLTPRADDLVLLAAEFAGIDRVFEVGGAQAIAAAAFGTQTIPRVDKIVGPGNSYVTAAKRAVFGHCDIDGIAGPSEILVVADATADAELVAADLISQAEHDRDAAAVLVTAHEPLADEVDVELERQLEDLPRAEIASAALREQGAAVIVGGLAGMIGAANDYAPEHLELLIRAAREVAPALTTCGAIFVGEWTPEAAGDYTAGPSHVLPTAGAARFASPLGVWDFVKYTSVLELRPEALRAQAEAIVALARAEGLEGHARAVERRLARGDA